MNPTYKFVPASQAPSGARESPLVARPVRDSASEYSELALPNDANAFGFLLGGKVMHLVDLAGALAAMRHARRPMVTASIDHMSFLHPVHIGQLIILRSSVNRVFQTSMEVGVKVFYVTEQDHSPLEHGTLEYSADAGNFLSAHSNQLLQKQAQAYVESYLRRKHQPEELAKNPHRR